MGSVSSGGQHPPPFALGIQLCLTHQPGHPFAGDASPLILADSRWMRGLPYLPRWVANTCSNLLGELSIFSFAPTGRTLAPGIQATFRDSKHVAHDHDRKFLLVLFDKLIFHLDSREKMLTTFFSISRSCCTLSSSRLRRRFSSSNGVWCPLPGNASLPCSANSLRHW